MTIRLLALCGSARRDSLNRRLLAAAVTAARAGGATVSECELTPATLPLYDGDAEEAHGLPKAVHELKQQVRAHHGLLIASPEYNGFFTPLLKNAIDWISRPVEGEPSPFAGQCAALFAASAGSLGGIRGLPHLRLLLGNLGVVVAPAQLALPHADVAFASDGRLRETGPQAQLDRCIAELLRLCRRLHDLDEPA